MKKISTIAELYRMERGIKGIKEKGVIGSITGGEKTRSYSNVSAQSLNALISISKDINIVRQNIVKLVKLQGGTPATKADEYFRRTRKTAPLTAKEKVLTPTKSGEKEPSKDSFWKTLVKGGLLLGLAAAIGKFFVSPEGVGAVTDFFKGFFKNLQKFTSFVSGVAKNLFESKDFQETAKNILKNIFDFVKSGVVGAAEIIKRLVEDKGFIDGLKEMFISVFSALGTVIEKLGTGLIDILKNPKFSEAVVKIFTTVLNALKGAFDFVKENLQNPEVKKAIDGIISSFVAMVRDLIKTLHESLTKALQQELGMGEWSSKIVSGIILAVVGDLWLFHGALTELLTMMAAWGIGKAGAKIGGTIWDKLKDIMKKNGGETPKPTGEISKPPTPPTKPTGEVPSEAVKKGTIPTETSPKGFTKSPSGLYVPENMAKPTPSVVASESTLKTTSLPGKVPLGTPTPAEVTISKLARIGVALPEALFTGAATTLAYEQLPFVNLKKQWKEKKISDEQFIKAYSILQDDLLFSDYRNKLSLEEIASRLEDFKQNKTNVGLRGFLPNETMKGPTSQQQKDLEAIEKLKIKPESGFKNADRMAGNKETRTVQKNADRMAGEGSEPAKTPSKTSASYTGSSDSTKTPTIKKVGDANDAYQYFMNNGWTPEQAAGIVGNLIQESQLNPTAVGDGGKAYGIAQWHPDRQENFRKVFKKDIRDSSFEEQLQFVNWELNNSEKKAGDEIRKAQSINEAAYAVDKFYERSRGTELQQRMKYASLVAKQEYKAPDMKAITEKFGAPSDMRQDTPSISGLMNLLEGQFGGEGIGDFLDQMSRHFIDRRTGLLNIDPTFDPDTPNKVVAPPTPKEPMPDTGGGPIPASVINEVSPWVKDMLSLALSKRATSMG